MMPWSVRNELDLAIQRTGLTYALEIASARLPILFSVPPYLLHNLLSLYQETDKNKVLNELDITETTQIV